MRSALACFSTRSTRQTSMMRLDTIALLGKRATELDVLEDSGRRDQVQSTFVLLSQAHAWAMSISWFPGGPSFGTGEFPVAVYPPPRYDAQSCAPRPRCGT